MKLKNFIRLYLTGFVMGTADLIPGVSGGTIAFISGIYEELLLAIKTVTGKSLKLLLGLRFREAFASLPLRFLLPLGLGLFSAVFSLAGLLTYLLDNYTSLVWSFFFGLVLASTYVVAKRVVRWDFSDIVYFLLSAGFAYWLMGAGQTELGHSLPVIFISGMIAICAMILPGISGSFILVLLGQYDYVLSAVTNLNFLTIIVFVFGTILGISIFARFLSWLFKKHHDVSVAVLAGFMLGSLRKIWPFSPNDGSFFNPWIWLLVLLGFVMVILLTRYQALKERTEDLPDQSFAKDHQKSLESQK